MSFTEMCGYAASLAVLISFLTTSVIKLRLINLIGCLLFVLYGTIINAYPVAIVNTIISGIQVYFLYKMLKTQTNYRIVKCRFDDLFLHDFIYQHIDDIKYFSPQFSIDLPPDSDSYLCMVNEELAGVWIAKREGNSLEIYLEYVRTKYRDCGMGNFIYHKKRNFFINEGINSFVAKNITGKHSEYLQKIGFIKNKDNGHYYLNINY